MNINENLICWLPGDEESGDTVYDHARRNDATFTNAQRSDEGGVPGRSLMFNGFTSCNIANLNALGLTQDFSLHFWVKSDCESVVPVMHFSGELKFTREEIATTPGQWAAIGISYSVANNRVKYYDNGQLTETFDVSGFGEVVGITINQPWYGSDKGFGELDDFRVYQTELSAPDMGQLFAYKYNPLKYFIDGTDLADHGLTVYAHTGLLSFPAMKEQLKVDWPDYHGEVIDLSAPTYEARDITLSCWVRADDRFQFFDKVNRLVKNVLMKSGTRELILDMHPTKPMVYHVYPVGGFDVLRQTKYNAAIQAGKVEFKFREPEPFKRILKHVATTSNSTANVQMTTAKMVTIYWGDGLKSTNQSGEINLTHYYADAGEYYITITGNVEEITNFSTDLIEIWSLL